MAEEELRPLSPQLRDHLGWADPSSRPLGSIEDTPLPEAGGASGDDDSIVTAKHVEELETSLARDLAFGVACFLSGGLLPLACFWFPGVYARVRFRKVEGGKGGRVMHVLVESLDGLKTVARLEAPSEGGGGGKLDWAPFTPPGPGKVGVSDPPRSFTWRAERFWLSAKGGWQRLAFDLARPPAELHRLAARCVAHSPQADSGGLPLPVQRRLTYGPNVLLVVVHPFLKLLLLEFFKPFFIFQAFSIGVWFQQGYLTYAYVILTLTLISAFYNAIETWRNLRAIKKLAASECLVERMAVKGGGGPAGGGRGGGSGEVSSSALMPGDVVRLRPGTSLPCDCLLLTGQAVLNEV